MKKKPDKLLPILLEIEVLAEEEREALFFALFEQYQWTPPTPGPAHRGVSAGDFGVSAEHFEIRDYDAILPRGGAEAEMCESSRTQERLEELESGMDGRKP